MIASPRFKEALAAGARRLSAWADLLDDLNLFPVADADTGRNLTVSLSPLRRPETDGPEMIRRMMAAAAGNAGTIAAGFFSGFLAPGDRKGLAGAAEAGRNAAWRAVARPAEGTMLTFFDALARTLAQTAPADRERVARIIDDLAVAVEGTAHTLPVLRKAGVVDAGALGMFIFFEGFFTSLADCPDLLTPATRRFGDRVRRPDGTVPVATAAVSEAAVSEASGSEASGSGPFGGSGPIGGSGPFGGAEPFGGSGPFGGAGSFGAGASGASGDCISALLDVGGRDLSDVAGRIAGWGESVVITPHGDRLKIHLHSDRAEAVREKLSTVGRVVRFRAEAMADDRPPAAAAGPIHIVTDAAGSLSRATARRLGVTLLDSVILTPDTVVPETHLPPETLYEMMKKGVRVTTAQASAFERHQRYEGILSRFDRVLYLCVGSVYTGNFEIADQWRRMNDPEGRMHVLDTGAASGRLGIVALATALFAGRARDPASVIDYAGRAAAAAGEMVFLDCLSYLAAGGRISRTGAFFGDLFRVKPVITPTARGAEKVGVVRNHSDQIAFALDRLAGHPDLGDAPLLLLQYSDNHRRVTEEIRPRLAERVPGAEILVEPLSLTSGVHMGPGTWAVAYLPESLAATDGRTHKIRTHKLEAS